MFEEKIKPKKEIGTRGEEPGAALETEGLEVATQFSGAKTLDEIHEEVPQDIKNKIIDLEAEQ